MPADLTRERKRSTARHAQHAFVGVSCSCAAASAQKHGVTLAQDACAAPPGAHSADECRLPPGAS
eukprot:11148070-Alexandrium_andersonii.AAC.2